MTWDEINNKRLPFIRFGENLFSRMYGEIRREFVSSVQNLTTPQEFTQAAQSFKIDDSIVQGAYLRFYLKTGIAFAKSQVKSVKRRMEIKEGEEDLNASILEDIWIKKMTEFVKTKTADNISSVIKTTYSDIQIITKKAVEEGIDQGWGMDKIARKIAKDQGDIDLWKALRIARTEVVSASNEGVKVGAEELPGNKEKVWISTFRKTSREDHMAMDGVRVGLNELFTLPNGHQLEYPVDPDPMHGDAGDKVNCGCGYEIIVTPEIY